MCRIVEIKRFSHAAPLAALAVVKPQQRDRKAGEQLDRGIHLVDEEEVNERVNDGPEHHPQHLLFEVAAVCADIENGNGCDAAPVGRERDRADQENDHDLLPCLETRAVVHPQQHHAPRKRPDHAGLIEKGSVGKRQHRPAEAEVVRKMRNERENEQPDRVLFPVVRVVIPLRNEKPHDRRGESADDVQSDRPPLVRKPRFDRPDKMVDRHRDDRDQFQLVGIQSSLCFHVSPSGSPAHFYDSRGRPCRDAPG